VPLLVVGVGWAQEGDQSRANDQRTGTEAVADMVITDPDADLGAIVAQATGVSGSSTVIPAAAFVDDGFGEQNYALTYGGAYIFPYGTSPSFCMQAPVYLPNGATVTAYSGHVYDNSSGDLWRLELRRFPYTNLNGSAVMADAPTSGAVNAYQATVDLTIANAVVDNSQYAYFAAVCANTGDANLRLYAVQVFYTK
jgi:hypothetical protein